MLGLCFGTVCEAVKVTGGAGAGLVTIDTIQGWDGMPENDPRRVQQIFRDQKSNIQSNIQSISNKTTS
jgi:hypothetical protein